MMKKYKCQNMECHYSCELRSDLFPHKCVCWDYIPQWVEMEENKGFVEKALREAQEKIAGKTPALPKLTAEVFDLPDCPEWAKWAAVDECGCVRLFSDSPWLGESCWNWSKGEVRKLFGVKFDASNWQKSKIKRPKKNTLPDWCVGEWVAYYTAKGYKYFKIAKIELNRLYSEDGKFSLMCNVSQARLRPYNADEMRSLVGKVIEWKGDAFVVTAFSKERMVVVFDSIHHTAEDLINDCYTIDGSPCGVLEHIENGEWVE